MNIYPTPRTQKITFTGYHSSFTKKFIIWKSVLRGQMVRLFWVIVTVREFEGEEVIKPFVHKRDYSDFFRTWTDGVIILGKTCFYIL